jgi:hypothetical protein
VSSWRRESTSHLFQQERAEVSAVADVKLAENTLTIHVLGMDRLWALREPPEDTPLPCVGRRSGS